MFIPLSESEFLSQTRTTVNVINKECGVRFHSQSLNTLRGAYRFKRMRRGMGSENIAHYKALPAV